MKTKYKGYHRVSYKGRTWIVKNRKTNAPQWVLDFSQNVIRNNSHKRMPVIEWRNANRFHSSGVTHSIEGRITIQAGTDPQDQKLVLLHELAHYLSPKACGHNMRFWRLAWKLYYMYGIEESYAVKREKSYKLKAMVAYKNMKITNQIWKGGEKLYEETQY